MLTRNRSLLRIWILALVLFAAGCQPLQPIPASSTPTLEPTPGAAPAEATPSEPVTQVEAAAPVTLTLPLTATEAVTVAVAATVATTLPVPVLLEIPEIGLETPVEPMGWDVVTRNGQRTTRWVLPEDAAGWHVNSARAGSDGNVIISGSQLRGASVFAPLALGEVQAGQEIILTDSNGQAFVYRVTETPDPLPIQGAGADTAAALAALAAPSDTGKLTLITGWPDFTTTHRLFVVAELVGPAD